MSAQPTSLSVPHHEKRATTRRRIVIVTSVLLSVFLGHVKPASADKDYASLVVQDRIYSKSNELALHAGVLPLDAFTKGLTLGGSYTIHFSDTWGWEVIQGNYSFHKDSSLRDDLEAFLELQPTPFEVVNYYATSSIMYKPLYWKGAWRNKSLLRGEVFFNAGAGYGKFTRSKRAVASVGGGVRLYTGHSIWMRFDMRELAFANNTVFDGFEVHHELWIGLAASLAF